MTEIQKWADGAMFKAAPMAGQTDDNGVVPSVYLLQATPDPLGAIAASSRMYKGEPTYSLADITDEERREYWEDSKKGHLHAPWEFVQFHFFIEGIDRAFTHQMVRQRTATYAQESLRFAVKEGLAKETTVPPSLIIADDEKSLPISAHGQSMKELARDTWDGALDAIEKAYEALIDMGIPAEDARGLLPHCVATRIHYRTSLNDLINHSGNRLCTQAQFIWRVVFSQIVNAIRNYDTQIIPAEIGEDDHDVPNWQFKLIADDGVFKPVCYRVGHCPWKASFDRGCTIRDRVDRGEFDKIDDREWLLDPTAARL